MRKAQKKQAVDFVKLLGQAHDEIRKAVAEKQSGIAMDLLGQCQEGAIELSKLIGRTEGEGLQTTLYLEEYCKLTYKIYQEIIVEECAREPGEAKMPEDTKASGESKMPEDTKAPGEIGAVQALQIHDRLQSLLHTISNSVDNDIKVKLEIAFLPYKASMWDSMESVWSAAAADPDCDAYVVPIPYYERKADGSLGTCHYEGNELPDYVPVINYTSYHLEERQPDIVYIHNPYDQGNYVTTVDPAYYSGQLKKNTKLLVYIPYYVTSGDMSEGQSLCLAYYNADYIVVQAEKYKSFFDPVIPREKIIPLGSPKFDRVIGLCNNPPEPPHEWKERMAGRKVYFYNTSIQGMLSDTRRFLLKMEYVFRCFQGREDACLLWRPHPLLESTFVSMRKEYKPFYDQLKRVFIQNHLGIYDDTPDMEGTIALSHAYIGDAYTSVTAMFGIAGKPLFILNQLINTLPGPDDWRGEILTGFFPEGQDEWMITQGNKLYHSPGRDYHYRFYCDLSEYTSGGYYLQALEINGEIYVCPRNAQDILIVSEGRIVKRIELRHCLERMGAFCNALRFGNYLFLIPFRYPAIVRYDVTTGCLDYVEGYNDIFVKQVGEEWRAGGCYKWKDRLLLASPVDNQVLAIHSESLEGELLTVGALPAGAFPAGASPAGAAPVGAPPAGASPAGASLTGGCIGMTPYDHGICLIPYTGTGITWWNPDTGDAFCMGDVPQGFQCKNRMSGFSCMERPFSFPAVYENKMVVPPMCGNAFLEIDMENGSVQVWEPPFEVLEEGRNGYYPSWDMGTFLRRTDTLGEGTFRFFYSIERKLYDINIRTKEYREIEIVFDKEELIAHQPGFGRCSEWLRYGCEENALYSLKEFLDGTVIGRPFQKDIQIQTYREIAANSDGTCGKKIHQFACSKV